nr:G-protein coupled receptor Mth2 [Aedes albopictus]
MAPVTIIEDDWNFTTTELQNVDLDVYGDNLWFILGCLLGIVLMSTALALHLIIPSLRNVRGYKICFLLFGMISIYVAHLVMNTRTTLIACQALGYFYAYSVMFSVLWLNVLCFDCFASFRSGGGNSAEKNRFAYTCLYGWGGPVALALFSVYMERATTIDPKFKPNFSTWSCVYHRNPTAEFLYYFLPLLILMISGLSFLIAGALRARTLRLVPRNVVRFDRSSDHRRFSFAFQLFLAVTVACVLDISSSVWYEIPWIYWVSSVYVYVLAILVFLICVCNSEVKQWFVQKCC